MNGKQDHRFLLMYNVISIEWKNGNVPHDWMKAVSIPLCVKVKRLNIKYYLKEKVNEKLRKYDESVKVEDELKQRELKNALLKVATELCGRVGSGSGKIHHGSMKIKERWLRRRENLKGRAECSKKILMNII